MDLDEKKDKDEWFGTSPMFSSVKGTNCWIDRIAILIMVWVKRGLGYTEGTSVQMTEEMHKSILKSKFFKKSLCMVSIQRGVGAVPKTLQKYGKLCCVRVFIMQNFKKRKAICTTYFF